MRLWCSSSDERSIKVSTCAVGRSPGHTYKARAKRAKIRKRRKKNEPLIGERRECVYGVRLVMSVRSKRLVTKTERII